jgi:hypothetical protein
LLYYYCTVIVTLVTFTIEPADPDIEIVYVPAGVPPIPPPLFPPPPFPPPQAARKSRPEIIRQSSDIGHNFFFLDLNPGPINTMPRIGRHIE